MVCATAIQEVPVFNFGAGAKHDHVMWVPMSQPHPGCMYSTADPSFGQMQVQMLPVIHSQQSCWPAAANGGRTTWMLPDHLGFQTAAQQNPANVNIPQAEPQYSPAELQSGNASLSDEAQGQPRKTRRRPRRQGRRGTRQVDSSNADTSPAPVASTTSCPDEEEEEVDNESSTAAECRQLMSQLSSGGEAAQEALESISKDVARLAFDPLGCRVVQEALQVANRGAIVPVLKGLHKHVREAAASPHANFVIQKVIELMPPSLANFVVEELSGIAADVACTRYGCRIICRLLEHFAFEPATKALIDDMLCSAGNLCRHTYGHYVIQLLFEHGGPEQKRRVVGALCQDAVRMAKSRNSGQIFVLALSTSSSDEQDVLINALLAKEGSLLTLAEDKYGWLVVRSILRLAGQHEPQVQQVLAHLQPFRERLGESKYGKRVLDDM